MGKPEHYWASSAGYRTGSGTTAFESSPPGKYYGAITWTGGELHLTGSKCCRENLMLFPCQ